MPYATWPSGRQARKRKRRTTKVLLQGGPLTKEGAPRRDPPALLTTHLRERKGRMDILYHDL